MGPVRRQGSNRREGKVVALRYHNLCNKLIQQDYTLEHYVISTNMNYEENIMHEHKGYFLTAT